jgi:hypothetical protein
MKEEDKRAEDKIPSPEFVREIVARGETYLQGQLTLATSADQRAASMASIFSAVSLGIAAGLFTADQMHFGTMYWPLIISGGVTGLMFLTASALCGFAAHPIPFNLPGTQPKNWTKDINAAEDENKSLFGLAKNFQDKIDKNRRGIERNAKWFKWGLRSGIGAPAIGLGLLGVMWLGQHFC